MHRSNSVPVNLNFTSDEDDDALHLPDNALKLMVMNQQSSTIISPTSSPIFSRDHLESQMEKTTSSPNHKFVNTLNPIEQREKTVKSESKKISTANKKSKAKKYQITNQIEDKTLNHLAFDFVRENSNQ